MIIEHVLTVGLGMQRRGGGGIGSGAVRYGDGEYRPDGKHPGAVIGAPWSPLLPIILSGEYIIVRPFISAACFSYQVLHFRFTFFPDEVWSSTPLYGNGETRIPGFGARLA